MASPKPSLLRIYARNVEHLAFQRGWSTNKLASELGVSLNTVNRVRFARSRYLDPEVFEALLEVYNCEPNDLLLPQPLIQYLPED